MAHGGRAATRTSAAAETVSLLQALVSASNPVLHARAARLRRLVHHLCVVLSLPHAERFELAASLSGLLLWRPTAALFIASASIAPGDDAERCRFRETWSQTAAILARVHALRDVAAIVAEAAGRADRPGDPPHPPGGQVLRAATIADAPLPAVATSTM